MTATRADLHLKPLLPIFELFDKSNMSYLICTSDLPTGLMLKDSDITFLSIFEEVKLLSTAFKNSHEGKNLSLEFKKLTEQFLLEELLSRTVPDEKSDSRKAYFKRFLHSFFEITCGNK